MLALFVLISGSEMIGDLGEKEHVIVKNTNDTGFSVIVEKR